MLYWRGSASGGKNTANNSHRFHRHRFVAMLNATLVEIAEGLLHAGNESTVGLGYERNFRLVPGNAYHLATQSGGSMAEWVNSWADVAFTDLQCSELAANGTCEYTDEYFSISTVSKSLAKRQKYTVVLDGNGGDDAGSFLSALGSGMVALKSSVYRQWYDSRVVPRLHYVPLDPTFVDLYAVMEYFLGTAIEEGATEFPHAHVEVEKHEHHFSAPHWDEDNEEEEAPSKLNDGYRHKLTAGTKRSENEGSGHDEQAQKIAEAGQEWAAKVLRKEDMQVYLYRVLLEYARVMDNLREKLGWVEDILIEMGRR
jgi:hypothetical protein